MRASTSGPNAFIDSPIGRDGAFARLAGGLQFHAGYQLIVVEDGRRAQSIAIDIAQLADVIAALPDAQAENLTRIAARLAAPRPALTLGARTVRFDQPQTMGILNMTPDSFSDGGAHLDRSRCRGRGRRAHGGGGGGDRRCRRRIDPARRRHRLGRRRDRAHRSGRRTPRPRRASRCRSTRARRR